MKEIACGSARAPVDLRLQGVILGLRRLRDQPLRQFLRRFQITKREEGPQRLPLILPRRLGQRQQHPVKIERVTIPHRQIMGRQGAQDLSVVRFQRISRHQLRLPLLRLVASQ